MEISTVSSSSPRESHKAGLLVSRTALCSRTSVKGGVCPAYFSSRYFCRVRGTCVLRLPAHFVVCVVLVSFVFPPCFVACVVHVCFVFHPFLSRAWYMCVSFSRHVLLYAWYLRASFSRNFLLSRWCTRALFSRHCKRLPELLLCACVLWMQYSFVCSDTVLTHSYDLVCP